MGNVSSTLEGVHGLRIRPCLPMRLAQGDEQLAALYLIHRRLAFQCLKRFFIVAHGLLIGQQAAGPCPSTRSICDGFLHLTTLPYHTEVMGELGKIRFQVRPVDLL
jgi:hypothetical protein